MTSQPTHLPEPTLGKYHIVRPLKVGGTAAIYLAIMRGENNFSREVVIKRPLPHLVADQRSRLMFIDEAHIAARLSHPNICQVLDLVSRDDEVYLVLEYLRGVDLREMLKRCIELGRLVPPEVGVWIGVECAAGLDCAHEATGLEGDPLNLVHRDVSPKNIRITDAGSVKVIDFGIARAMNRATETAAGTIKGTLGYMSPEQILGDDIDRRSDIFAFGIVLFQMLTLRNPFDGPNLKERVRKLTQADIPLISEFNPALDGEIAGIVARCLDRDIDKRYATMKQVQGDLDRYLARLQVVSPRQQLIDFLDDIFPAMHDTDPALKSALSEVSGVTGRIDTSQRLRFPDDDDTERVPSSGTGFTQHGATHATVAGETENATSATRQASSAPAADPVTTAGKTRPLPAAVSVESVAVPAPQPPAQSKLPLIIGAVLAVAVIVFAIRFLAPSTTIEVTPIAGASGATTSNPNAAPSGPTGATLAAIKTPADATNKVTAPSGVSGATSAKAVTTKAPPPKKAIRRTPPPPRSIDRNRARDLFRAGNRLGQQGRLDDAKLAFHLAWSHSGRKPNASLFLNLGLLHNKAGRTAKAKACLRGYLARRPDAADAPKVRMLVSSFSATKTVSCVSSSELKAARRAYTRRGSVVDGWVKSAR